MFFRKYILATFLIKCHNSYHYYLHYALSYMFCASKALLLQEDRQCTALGR